MGPGKKKAVVATERGLKLQRGALAQLPRAFAYGIGPFPLARELILVAVAWLLMLRSGTGASRSIVALIFLVAGLLILKAGARDYHAPVVWQQFLGAANIAFGAAIMLFGRHRLSPAPTRAPSPDPAGRDRVETGL